MRRTKIVCTIGPASEGLAETTALIAAGMDVARLNFSHGTLEEHERRINNIRAAQKRAGRPIAILLDIQGPKIRIGNVKDAPRQVKKGERLILTINDNHPASNAIYVPYPSLTKDVCPGQVVFLDDGLIELRVEDVKTNDLVCVVVVGGDLKSRKGLTLPGICVDLPPLGERDLEHIKFGVAKGVDYIAASFVRRAEHVEAVRQAVRAAGGDLPIIAKVESEEGVRNIEGIVDAADAVMVARGDLGIELPPEEVPLVQKHMIAQCNLAGKPVITATQMLDSMVRNPRPTRAEVTDVANAILDGTDAVMLSGETAVGKYAVEAVTTMHKVATHTEKAFEFGKLLNNTLSGGQACIAEAIARSTCDTAHCVNAVAILCSTQSGASARLVSKYRPQAPIIAITPYQHVAQQLALVWGVYPMVGPRTNNTDDMMDAAISAALESKLVAEGDVLAVAAGVRTDTPGSTNMLLVHIVERRQGK